MVLRLTAVRARCLAGGVLRDGMDQRVVWKPSQGGPQGKHPELPADACVEGRLVARQVKPDNGAEPFLLALFPTLPDPPEEVENIWPSLEYRTRLRSLKSTLVGRSHLHHTGDGGQRDRFGHTGVQSGTYGSCITAARKSERVEPRAFQLTKVWF